MDIKHRADAKQKSIIEASIALFLKYTANKTNIDEIAAAAHVSKVTLYKYFQDKSGLYSSVYSRIEDDLGSDISRQARGGSPVIQKMMGYINVYTEFIGSGRLGLCEELSGLSGDVRDRFASFQISSEKLIFQLIAEAKEQGLVRTDIDDAVIFHYINMGLSYFRHDERYRVRMQSDTSFRQAYMALMLQSVFNDRSTLV